MLIKALEWFLTTPVYLLSGIAIGVLCFLAMWGYCILLSRLWQIGTFLGGMIVCGFKSAAKRIRQFKAKCAQIKSERLLAQPLDPAKSASNYLFPGYYSHDAGHQRLYLPYGDVHAWLVHIQPDGLMTVRCGGTVLNNVPCEGWQLYPTGEPVSEWIKRLVWQSSKLGWDNSKSVWEKQL